MYVLLSWGRKALLFLLYALVFGACDGANPSRSISEDGALVGQGLVEGISGRVASANSHDPIAGAAVVPQSLDSPTFPIPEIGVDTDRDGRYEWPLRSGRYAVTVVAEGYKPATLEVQFRTDEVHTLDFLLEEE
jgi:hypothetical protein